MDMQSLLPLLLQRTGGNNSKMNTLLQMTQGKKPDLDTVMQMAMKRSDKRPAGLSVVADIAPNEIMGKLTKFFLKQA